MKGQDERSQSAQLLQEEEEEEDDSPVRRPWPVFEQEVVAMCMVQQPSVQPRAHVRLRDDAPVRVHHESALLTQSKNRGLLQKALITFAFLMVNGCIVMGGNPPSGADDAQGRWVVEGMRFDGRDEYFRFTDPARSNLLRCMGTAEYTTERSPDAAIGVFCVFRSDEHYSFLVGYESIGATGGNWRCDCCGEAFEAAAGQAAAEGTTIAFHVDRPNTLLPPGPLLFLGDP